MLASRATQVLRQIASDGLFADMEACDPAIAAEWKKALEIGATAIEVFEAQCAQDIADYDRKRHGARYVELVTPEGRTT